MRLLKWLALGVIVLAVVVVGIGFVLPDRGHVERSIVIDAKPATVFTLLNSFSRFNEWSPWADLDPDAKTTFEGPVAGVGAKMIWAGNDAVGTGSQEIIESTPYEQIRIKLVFGDWDSEQTATYRLAPEDEGTRVTWAYDGAFGGNLMARYFGLMLDGMIGGDYEKGLAKLETLAESLPKGDISMLNAELVDVAAVPLAYISGTTTTDPDAISTALAVAFSKIVAFTQARGLRRTGPPLSIARRWDQQNGTYAYDAGIPVDRTDVQTAEGSEVKLGTTHGGKAIRVVYKGAARDMGATYDALATYAELFGYRSSAPSWEQYMSDLATTPESELVTHIYMPVQ